MPSAPSLLKPATTYHRNLHEGILLMVAAMLILPGIDAIAKGLSGSISPGQLVWSRFFFQALLLLPFVVRVGGLRVGRKLWGHAARGVLLALATLLLFMALRQMPLADTLAIFFVEPLALVLLSAWLLGEPLGWRRLLAVSVGFCGALIIVRPSYAIFGLTALLPAVAGCLFALYVVLTRWLVRDGGALVMQFYAGIFGLLTMSIALFLGAGTELEIFLTVWPTATEWLFLVALGAFGTVGHLCIVLATRRVGASVIAPFQYLEIISAAILGLIFFNDFPDTTTWMGVAIIIGSGLYVFQQERQTARRQDALAAESASSAGAEKIPYL